MSPANEAFDMSWMETVKQDYREGRPNKQDYERIQSQPLEFQPIHLKAQTNFSLYKKEVLRRLRLDSISCVLIKHKIHNQPVDFNGIFGLFRFTTNYWNLFSGRGFIQGLGFRAANFEELVAFGFCFPTFFEAHQVCAFGERIIDNPLESHPEYEAHYFPSLIKNHLGKRCLIANMDIGFSCDNYRTQLAVKI